MELAGSPRFKNILAGFGFKDSFGLKRLGNGHINDTYLVTFRGESNNYVLQRINRHVFTNPAELMQNIAIIKEHIITNNSCTDDELSFLNYMKTKSGELLFRDTIGGYWRLNKFVENTYTVEFVRTKEQAYAAAYAFGKLNLNLTSLPLRRLNHTIKDFHHADLRMRKFYEVMDSDPKDRVKLAEDEISLVLKNEHLVTSADQLLSEMPLRITHNDAKINNVLFNRLSGKVACVIDLDTVMSGYLIYDFGDMVRSFSPSVGEEGEHSQVVELRKPIYKALVEGYLTATHTFISNAEKDKLVFGGMLMTYLQALRFLTDYIAGDIYYHKISKPNQNLERARNQLMLLHSIATQQTALESIVHQFRPAE